jgi:hypothetical protein
VVLRGNANFLHNSYNTARAGSNDVGGAWRNVYIVRCSRLVCLARRSSLLANRQPKTITTCLQGSSTLHGQAAGHVTAIVIASHYRTDTRKLHEMSSQLISRRIVTFHGIIVGTRLSIFHVFITAIVRPRCLQALQEHAALSS